MGKYSVFKDWLARMNADQIGQSLDTQMRDAGSMVDRFDQLNAAGLDFKGQLSSAYASSGVGLGVSAKIDAGAVIAPFLHLTGAVKISGEVTANALVVLMHGPSRMWYDHIEKMPQPVDPEGKVTAPLDLPDWESPKPLGFGFMRGRCAFLEGEAAAEAWAGLSSPKDFDETGLSVGIDLTGSVNGRFTSLDDGDPKFFGKSTHDDGLKQAVENLIDYDLKNKVAAWLLRAGNGMHEAVEAGAPPSAAARAAAYLKEHASDGANMAVTQAKNLLDTFDEATIPDIATGIAAQNVISLVKIAKDTITDINNNSLKTKDLVARLDKAVSKLVGLKRTLQGYGFYEKREDRIKFARRHRRQIRTINLRIKEAKGLQERLTERAEAKRQRQSASNFSWKPWKKSQRNPAYHLYVSTLTAQGTAGAGAKANLALSSVLKRRLPAFQLAGRAELSCQAKRIKIRFHSFVPGYEKGAEKPLLSTQETLVHNTFWSSIAKGAARTPHREDENASLEVREAERARGYKEAKGGSWSTMSYKSVLVNWFDTGTTAQSIPNGSGVSFGLSVEAKRLSDYIRACKPIKGKSSLPESFNDKALDETEDTLRKQLRVTREELRLFMRRQQHGLGSATQNFGSFLIESTFCFTSPQTFAATKKRPQDLLGMAAAKALHSVTDADSEARPDTVRLQAIRLRYRIRDDQDRRRNPLGLGIAPEPFSEDKDVNPFDEEKDVAETLLGKVMGTDFSVVNGESPDFTSVPVQLGFNADWISRVGTEAIVDLKTIYFPNPYPKLSSKACRDLESARNRDFTDLLVPGVTLFSQ